MTVDELISRLVDVAEALDGVKCEADPYQFIAPFLRETAARIRRDGIGQSMILGPNLMPNPTMPGKEHAS